jgi:hypothetical protein
VAFKNNRLRLNHKLRQLKAQSYRTQVQSTYHKSNKYNQHGQALNTDQSKSPFPLGANPTLNDILKKLEKLEKDSHVLNYENIKLRGELEMNKKQNPTKKKFDDMKK